MKKQILYVLLASFTFTVFATPLKTDAAGSNCNTITLSNKNVYSSNCNFNTNEEIQNALSNICNNSTKTGTLLINGSNCNTILDSICRNTNINSSNKNTVSDNSKNCISDNSKNCISDNSKNCTSDNSKNCISNNTKNSVSNNTKTSVSDNTKNSASNNTVINNNNSKTQYDNTKINNSTEEDSNLTFAQEVVRLVNIERAKEGLNSLTADTKLEKAAIIRGKEIQTSFSHTRPDGSSFSTVLKENNISYKSAGENIAWGQKTPQEVVNAWMNSPGHKANIMSSKYSKIGVGYLKNSEGRNYWVQLFTN